MAHRFAVSTITEVQKTVVHRLLDLVGTIAEEEHGADVGLGHGGGQNGIHRRSSVSRGRVTSSSSAQSPAGQRPPPPRPRTFVLRPAADRVTPCFGGPIWSRWP